MSNLVKQVTIGEDTLKIGAEAENISYGNNSNVYAEIENLKNGSNGGNTVSTTDLVVENSLTVNGSVVEGKGHNSNVIGKAWISLGIDPITINSTSNGTSYIKCSQESINIYKDLSYKYKTVLNNSKSYFMERLNCAAQGIGTYFKCDFYMQQYHRKVENVLCMMSDYEVALYHNEDGLLTFDSRGSIIYIYFKEAASISEEKNIHIAGKYSDVNNSNINIYAHVVGGGTSDSDRKNIYTLDWSGNAIFAGDISFGTTNEEISVPIVGGVNDWTNANTTIAEVNYKYMCHYPVPPVTTFPFLIKGKYYEGYFITSNGDTYPMILYFDGNSGNEIITIFTNTAIPVNYITDFKIVTVNNKITSLLGTIQNLEYRIEVLEAKLNS